MNADGYMKCEAMMHLEMALDRLGEIRATETCSGIQYLEHCDRVEEMKRRLWAALYLVQALHGGSRPENWHKVMNQAREYDAKAEAAEVLELARQGHFAKKD